MTPVYPSELTPQGPSEGYTVLPHEGSGVVMRLLVIDDQPEIRRGLVLPWWSLQAKLMGEELDVVWEPSWPGHEGFHAFDYFSLDNDLGPVGETHQEVIRELWPLQWDPNCQDLFLGRRAIVHSANIVAAPKITDIINCLGGEAHTLSLEGMIQWVYKFPERKMW